MTKIEQQIADLAQNISIPFSRASLFIIYFWFGILKFIDTSPANPLVESLQHKTLPFLSFRSFNVGFSIFEIIIGILFLFPKATRLVIGLLILHMCMTLMPLFLLPATTWQSFLTPTLEGQYIIKNLLIISLALIIAGKQYSKEK